MTGRLSPIDAARQRHRIASVAARTGKWLPSTGGRLTVRCPMPTHGHPDRAPSLHLYLDDNLWYCFGCSRRASDVVQWVQYTEGVDWRHAIEILDSGRPLTNCWAGVPNHTSHYWGSHDRAPMPDLGRTSRLRVQEALDAGLAYQRDDGTLADFYRQRVLIPIRDRQGQLAGLIGRNIGDSRWPKYKNPPRTLLYDKSVNLYQPLPPPNRIGQVIVVEGTIDAMAIAVAAIRTGHARQMCPVTQSGRVLSPVQLDSVLGLHPGPITVSFAGDAAGKESNRRLAMAIRARGRVPHIINLPNDADPASWLAISGPRGIALWDGQQRAPIFPSTSTATPDCGTTPVLAL